MAAAIREALPDVEIDLVPSPEVGLFNVSSGGVEYWNKEQRGGFPNQDEFVKYLVYKVKQAQAQAQAQPQTR